MNNIFRNNQLLSILNQEILLIGSYNLQVNRRTDEISRIYHAVTLKCERIWYVFNNLTTKNMKNIIEHFVLEFSLCDVMSLKI